MFHDPRSRSPRLQSLGSYYRTQADVFASILPSFSKSRCCMFLLPSAHRLSEVFPRPLLFSAFQRLRSKRISQPVSVAPTFTSRLSLKKQLPRTWGLPISQRQRPGTGSHRPFAPKKQLPDANPTRRATVPMAMVKCVTRRLILVRWHQKQSAPL